MLKKILIKALIAVALFASTPALAYEWGYPPSDYDYNPQPRRGYGSRPPPYPAPGRRGPQMEPCIYYGACEEPPRRGYRMPPGPPPPRDDW